MALNYGSHSSLLEWSQANLEKGEVIRFRRDLRNNIIPRRPMPPESFLPGEFPYFAKFPPEIRRMIWRIAADNNQAVKMYRTEVRDGILCHRIRGMVRYNYECLS